MMTRGCIRLVPLNREVSLHLRAANRIATITVRTDCPAPAAEINKYPYKQRNHDEHPNQGLDVFRYIGPVGYSDAGNNGQI